MPAWIHVSLAAKASAVTTPLLCPVEQVKRISNQYRLYGYISLPNELPINTARVMDTYWGTLLRYKPAIAAAKLKSLFALCIGCK